MKITIDVRMLHSSGIGVYIQNLVPRIMSLRTGDDFCLMGKPADREDAVWSGLKAFQWVDCHSPIYSLGQQWEIPRKTPKDTGLLWVPHYDIPAFYKGPMIVTVHDLFHLAMPQFVGGFHKRLYARWMFDQVARKAAAILAISQFTRNELLRLVKVGDDKVHVVYNGVDDAWFNSIPGERPHPKPYFLCVGNIKPHKNLKRLLDAFGMIKDQIPHDLFLVGQKEGFLSGDPEVPKLAGLFGGKVELTGKVSAELLRRYFAHAEALVMPSLYEGFGMPPLEAMACGCPVAASKAASIPEVCGEAALFFDPFDTKDIAEKMLQLVQVPSLRQNLIQKGKERAKIFSWDKCAAQTSALLDKIACS